MTLPPAAVISATISSAGESPIDSPCSDLPMSLTTTLAPRLAASRAYDAPSPRPAPVMTYTRPERGLSCDDSLTIHLLFKTEFIFILGPVAPRVNAGNPRLRCSAAVILWTASTVAPLNKKWKTDPALLFREA